MDEQVCFDSVVFAGMALDGEDVAVSRSRATVVKCARFIVRSVPYVRLVDSCSVEAAVASQVSRTMRNCL